MTMAEDVFLGIKGGASACRRDLDATIGGKGRFDAVEATFCASKAVLLSGFGIGVASGGWGLSFDSAIMEPHL